jgi:5'-nucleotidase
VAARLAPLLLLLLLLLSAPHAAVAAEGAAAPRAAQPAPVTAAAADGPWCTAATASPKDVISLYLAATNDVHNRVDEADPVDGGPCTPEKRARGVCAGGFARLASFFKQARARAAKECSAALVVDAGDQTTGQAWDVVYRQNQTAGLMKAAGYNITTLGNHEFDFSLGTLAEFVRGLEEQEGGGGGGNNGSSSSASIPMLGACSVSSFGNGTAARAMSASVRRHAVLEVMVPGVRVEEEPAARQSFAALLRRFFAAGREERARALKIVRQPRKLRIGLIGYVVSESARTNAAARNVSFVPDAEAAATCARELRAGEPGLDAVVALSHLGYDADVALAPSLAGLVDVIVGGHSHTFLSSDRAGPVWDVEKAGGGGGACLAARACDRPEGPYPTIVAARGAKAPPPPPIFQARFASIYAMLLRLDFALPPPSDEALSSALGRRGARDRSANSTTPLRLASVESATGASPVLLGGSGSSNPVEQDPEMLRYISTLRSPVDELARKPVGEALPPLGLALGDARRAESPLGTYLCGAMLAQANLADACLINAGALREGIPPGPVTRADLLSAHPYSNSLSARRVTAAALASAVRHGLTGAREQAGRFPQVDGLRIYLDYGDGANNNGTLANNPRFVALFLLPRRTAGGAQSPPSLGVELREGDANTTLVLASTDYLLDAGGDGFGMLASSGAKVEPPNDPPGAGASPLPLVDALAMRVAADTATAAGGAEASAVSAVDPRIVDCGAARRAGRCSGGSGLRESLYWPCCRVGTR